MYMYPSQQQMLIMDSPTLPVEMVIFVAAIPLDQEFVVSYFISFFVQVDP